MWMSGLGIGSGARSQMGAMEQAALQKALSVNFQGSSVGPTADLRGAVFALHFAL